MTERQGASPSRFSMPHAPDPVHDEESFLDHAASRCKQRGVSLTPIRRKVLALLRLQRGGLKAYDLLERIKLDHPSASPPTVYRALDFLIDQGLVHKIGRINHFVACNTDSHDEASLLLICPECGTITELHDEMAVVALSKSLEEAGHTLTGPEIEISALCRNCGAAPRQTGDRSLRPAI